MSLDHEKLDTYHRTLDLLDLVGQIYDAMPPGRAHLKDQLDRAATSIVLNTAEGAGEFSPDEKVRFYRIARRSPTETAAILDILERRKAVPATAIDPNQPRPTAPRTRRPDARWPHHQTQIGHGHGHGHGHGAGCLRSAAPPRFSAAC
jgi:four helix bundle protein